MYFFKNHFDNVRAFHFCQTFPQLPEMTTKTEHVGKTCNTYLNKSHDVESTFGNISVDMSRGTEHVGKICIIDQNEYHDDKSTLDFFLFIPKLNNEVSIEDTTIRCIQCGQIYQDKKILSEYIKSFDLV